MRDPKIVAPEILQYIFNMYPKLPCDDVFEHISRKAGEEGQPIVSKDAGYFMHLLVKLTGASKILEVGCNIGYSAMWMATAMPPNGKLDTLELNKDIALQAEENFQNAGVSHKIFIHVGPALDLIPKLTGPYDILFIDAAKSQYKDYLRLSLPKMRKGGLILVDNVLWSGRVLDENVAAEDTMTRAIQDFNKFFMSHPEIESTILTVGDGLGFAIKK